MSSLLVTGIGELVTNDPAHAVPGAGDAAPLGILRDAAVVVEGGSVAWTGPAAAAPAADTAYDAHGRVVLPGFVDSHAHLLFAGDRSEEFAARMSGPPPWRASSARCVARAPRPSRSRAATG